MSMIECPYCNYTFYYDPISDWSGSWEWVKECDVCHEKYKVKVREETIVFFDTEK